MKECKECGVLVRELELTHDLCPDCEAEQHRINQEAWREP